MIVLILVVLFGIVLPSIYVAVELARLKEAARENHIKDFIFIATDHCRRKNTPAVPPPSARVLQKNFDSE